MDLFLLYTEGIRCYLTTDLMSEGGSLIERAVREKNDKLLAAVAVGESTVQAETRHRTLEIRQECSVDHGLREVDVELLEVINVQKDTPTEYPVTSAASERQ
jgi:hypothetical protein